MWFTSSNFFVTVARNKCINKHFTVIVGKICRRYKMFNAGLHVLCTFTAIVMHEMNNFGQDLHFERV